MIAVDESVYLDGYGSGYYDGSGYSEGSGYSDVQGMIA